MPRCWDRKQPSNDKDPTKNTLDWTDPGGVIASGASNAGGNVFGLFGRVSTLESEEGA